MREILFRGKLTDNGEWVEGYYVHLYDYKGNESHRIYTGYSETDYGDFYPDWFEVDPETVVQFTGLYDNNGKRIFDGDVVSLACGIYRNKGIVKYFEARTRYGLIDKKYELFSFLNNLCINQYSINIIGNIHDNPELLEV